MLWLASGKTAAKSIAPWIGFAASCELTRGTDCSVFQQCLSRQRRCSPSGQLCRNIDNALNERLRQVRPEWRADREIGVLLHEDDGYNPEPDVTVIDRAIELDQVDATRFYFVAEVLSAANRPELRTGSDKPQVLAAKLAYYQLHDNCRGVLFVYQDRIKAELHARGQDWTTAILATPTDRIVIPDIGALGEFYRDTPLYPGKAG